jgi:hypothetical protein
MLELLNNILTKIIRIKYLLIMIRKKDILIMIIRRKIIVEK